MSCSRRARTNLRRGSTRGACPTNALVSNLLLLLLLVCCWVRPMECGRRVSRLAASQARRPDCIRSIRRPWPCHTPLNKPTQRLRFAHFFCLFHFFLSRRVSFCTHMVCDRHMPSRKPSPRHFFFFLEPGYSSNYTNT